MTIVAVLVILPAVYRTPLATGAVLATIALSALGTAWWLFTGVCGAAGLA